MAIKRDGVSCRSGLEIGGAIRKSGLNALAFVIVPGLPYALRPRTPLILLYWCVGVVAPRCPSWFVACAMAAVASLDLVWLVSGLFFLHPSWVVEALKYAPLMYPVSSWLYLAIGASTVATVVVPAYLVHRHPRVFSGGDYWVCALWRQPSRPICF